MKTKNKNAKKPPKCAILSYIHDIHISGKKSNIVSPNKIFLYSFVSSEVFKKIVDLKNSVEQNSFKTHIF